MSLCAGTTTEKLARQAIANLAGRVIAMRTVQDAVQLIIKCLVYLDGAGSRLASMDVCAGGNQRSSPGVAEFIGKRV